MPDEKTLEGIEIELTNADQYHDYLVSELLRVNTEIDLLQKEARDLRKANPFSSARACSEMLGLS